MQQLPSQTTQSHTMFKHHSLLLSHFPPHSSPQFKCIIISSYYVFYVFSLFDDDSFPLPLFIFLFYSCYCWCLLLLFLSELVLVLLFLLLPLGSFFIFFSFISSFFVCSLFAHFQLKHSSFLLLF